MIPIKIFKQYLKEFKDDANILIVNVSNNKDVSLDIFNVFKNLDTENLELQVIIEENNDQ